MIYRGRGQSAAHLPGMCAAIFPPSGDRHHAEDLRLRGGVDSLYSIVKLQRHPVATVAINGGQNAGILAAKILAASRRGNCWVVSKNYSESPEK